VKEGSGIYLPLLADLRRGRQWRERWWEAGGGDRTLNLDAKGREDVRLYIAWHGRTVRVCFNTFVH
jgi:hypothetical protein